jgi:hypothetical protein
LPNVDVSEVWHIDPDKGRVSGPDPQRPSYFSRAYFRRSRRQQLQLQEIKERLPGRV